MKITIIKKHAAWPLGDNEVSSPMGRYLIRMGVAVLPVEPEPVSFPDPVKKKVTKKKTSE